MEVTDTFKYIVITLNKKLTFGPHVQGVFKKCQQRLYLIRKLRSFHVDPKLLLLLYMSIIESALTYCSICFSLLSVNMIFRICKTASKIICLPTQPVSQLTERAMVRNAHAVTNDSAHPLNTEVDLLQSQKRYRCPRTRKNRFKNSFVPQAISRLNTLSFKCSSCASRTLNNVTMCVYLVENLKN